MKVVRKIIQCDSAAMTVEYVNGVVLEVHGASARRREEVDGLQWMVEAAKGIHLFHYRTQQLSPYTSKVLGWKRPGRIDRC